MTWNEKPKKAWEKAYPYGQPWITRAEQAKYHRLVKKLRARRVEDPPAPGPAIRDDPDSR